MEFKKQENDQLIATVYIIDGNPIKFEVPLSASKEFGLSEDIERSLLRNAMAVELDEKLLLIPYNNIKYIECIPAPPCYFKTSYVALGRSKSDYVALYTIS